MCSDPSQSLKHYSAKLDYLHNEQVSMMPDKLEIKFLTKLRDTV